MEDTGKITFKATGPDPKLPEEKRGRGRPKGSGGGRKPALTGVRDGLLGYVGMVGSTLTLFPSTRADGVVILSRGEPLVDSLLELAKTDKRVAHALRVMCVGGAWTGVIVSASAIALPIAANHGLLPVSISALFSVDENGRDLAQAYAEDVLRTDPEAESVPDESGPSVGSVEAT